MIAAGQVHEKVQEWRERAALFRRHGAEAQAATIEQLARELEETAREALDEVLTLEQARAESGYSDRQLRELIAQGRVPNAGRKGAPRVRRADLPRKPANSAALTAYDPDADALSLMRPRRAC